MGVAYRMAIDLETAEIHDLSRQFIIECGRIAFGADTVVALRDTDRIDYGCFCLQRLFCLIQMNGTELSLVHDHQHLLIDARQFLNDDRQQALFANQWMVGQRARVGQLHQVFVLQFQRPVQQMILRGQSLKLRCTG